VNVKEKNTSYTTRGLKRIRNAFRYSIDGLTATFKNEAAFRQELMLAAALVPLAIFLPVSLLSKTMMLSSIMIVLIVELTNSAIETVVDKASPEKHPLAKRAKDTGSAAVFLSLLNLAIVWGLCLFNHFFS